MIRTKAEKLPIASPRELPASRTVQVPSRTFGAVRGLPSRMFATRTGDHEFLPSHIEIMDTPASPRAVMFVWVICLMLGTALAWSWFAKLDIFAVASARVQPSGRSKVIQPFEPGKVQAVLVENGARVKAGDVLIELDPTETIAERDAHASQLESLEAEIARRAGQILAIRTDDQSVRPNIPAGTSPGIRAREEALFVAELGHHISAQASLRAQLAERIALRDRLRATISSRERLQVVLSERLNMRETLRAKDAGSRAAVLDALQPLEQEAASLANEKGQLGEAEASSVSVQRRAELLTQEFIAQQTQKMNEAEQKRDRLRQDLIKATAKANRTKLTAPIDGIVQQLAVTAVGQVVQTGQPLLVVVPSDGRIEVEALVLNRDIGFVKPGNEAAIKLEAFPFTRYGTIEGRVLRVSGDAIDDRDAVGSADSTSIARGQSVSAVSGTPRTQNLVFPVTVELSRSYMMVDGKQVLLSPGMMATVEIRTGDRRVIDYLLSPLREVVSQAAHER